jgi:hypothetical protein
MKQTHGAIFFLNTNEKTIIRAAAKYFNDGYLNDKDSLILITSFHPNFNA